MTTRRSRSLTSLVQVRAHYVKDAKVWTAHCHAPRCKFHEDHPSSNGAHMAAARHRRSKAMAKLHGAS